MVIDDNNLIIYFIYILNYILNYILQLQIPFLIVVAEKYSLINDLEDANLNDRVSEVRDRFCKVSVEDV